MLTPTQTALYDQACNLLDAAELAATVAFLVNTPSPTGEEADLAQKIVHRLRQEHIEASEQKIGPTQSNAHACLSGDGTGPSLLLYAPLDTVTSNSEAEDLPWAAAELLPEMRAHATIADGYVSGLGASNPKGHAACALLAFEILARARIPLCGDVYLGLGAGGMPTNNRPGMPENSGHGAGCAYMMQVGPRLDYAVITKPGWAVSWEEVGLAWYEIKVSGNHGYVGSRHLLPYSNAISHAAKVITRLEEWFPQWGTLHRSGLVAPQGMVAFVEGGCERTASFSPAVCRLRLDLRLSPRTSLEEADAALSEQISLLEKEIGTRITCKRIVGIPGTSTNPESRIVKTAIKGWEQQEQTEHKPIAGMSGATDANILRAYGIETARIGMPKVQRPDIDFQRGMNVVSVKAMIKLTKHLLYVAIATCCA